MRAALGDPALGWGRIAIAEAADQAQATLRAESFDALLVDLELDGAQRSLPALREAAGDAAVVVIGSPPDRETAWVPHPEPAAALSACLMGALERSRMRSELREARSELARCDERFRNIIQRGADGIVIVGHDGRVRFANHMAETMFGRPAHELRDHEFGHAVLAGDTTEIDLFTRGREPLVAELRASQTSWDGEPAQVISLRDVTDRKRADEQEKQLLLEQAGREQAERAARRAGVLAEAGAVLDASLDTAVTLNRLTGLLVPRLGDWAVVDLLQDGRVRRIARAHSDPSRRDRLAELERYAPTPNSPQPSAQVLRTGVPALHRGVTPERIRRLAVDGDHAALLMELGARSSVTVPLRGREGPLGTLTLVSGERDFDEEDLELAAEIGLRAGRAVENARLYEAALAASRAKSDFLAVVSHELRTPLNAILGYTQLLLETSLDASHQVRTRYLDAIRSAATHLNQIIEEILAYAQVEGGRRDVSASRVLLGELIDGLRTAAEPMMRDQGLDFRVSVPVPGTELWVDTEKLGRIALNLLSNAAKFTARGHVELAAVVEAGDLVLSVSDTGPGIPEGDLEHIFESFWVADRPLTRVAGGTGVGLSVARQLARLLGGTLSVESRVGAGSTFTLRVPAQGAPEPGS